MRVYIAGKITDDQIPLIMKTFEEAGHSITHKWTEFMERGPIISARDDLIGVRNCQALVAIMTDPEYEYRGTTTEIGAALITGKLVIIVNNNPYSHCRTNIFFHHPHIVHVNQVEQALAYLDNIGPTFDPIVEIHAEKQIGGTHYQKYLIEPIVLLETLENYDLGFHLLTAIKYMIRHQDKDGIVDLEKAKWYINRMIDNIESRQNNDDNDIYEQE